MGPYALVGVYIFVTIIIGIGQDVLAITCHFIIVACGTGAAQGYASGIVLPI
jgi:hypothetical protein